MILEYPMKKPAMSEYLNETNVIFYRSKFTIRPEKNPEAEIWPQIVSVIAKWVEGKEEGRSYRRKTNLLDELTNGIERISDRSEKVPTTCYASREFADGQLIAESEGSYIETRAFFEESPFPTYWAMDYVEQDSRCWFRRWHTSIGISARENGAYIVNSRVAILDDPTYLHDNPEIPPRNTPNFISNLLEIQGCRAYAGNTPLSQKSNSITAENFPEFLDQLTSAQRTIPLVVVTAQKYQPGVFPVDIESFAQSLRGTAVVYSLDNSNKETYLTYLQTFGEGAPAESYRIGAGSIRVFSTGLDFDEPKGSNRHYFYLPKAIELKGQDAIVADICGATTRMYVKSENEALDTMSVDSIQIRRRRAELEGKLREIQKNRDTVGSENAEDSESVEDLQNYIKELKENEALYEDYIDSLENANKEMETVRTESRQKDYRIASLEERIDRAESRARASEAQASFVKSLSKFPTSPLEALELAGNAFGEHLYIHENAKSSARDFKGKNYSEIFDVMRCLSEIMWPLFFVEGQDSVAADLFKERAGYNVTFTESPTTRDYSKFMRMRKIEYCGREISIEPHIKGRDKGSQESETWLRVHFSIDRETKKIVIGHCGKHLPVSSTVHRSAH